MYMYLPVYMNMSMSVRYLSIYFLLTYPNNEYHEKLGIASIATFALSCAQ